MPRKVTSRAGRPRKAQRKTPTNVTLDDAMKERFRRYCDAKGMSLSTFLGIAGDEKLAREKFV